MIASKGIRVVLFGFLMGVLLVTATPRSAKAQVLYGSVIGIVTDQSGARVPGAQVTITNDATGLKRQATAEAAGLYRLLDLPEGTYTIEVSAPGFSPLKKTNISVVIGQVNEQDLQIQLGAVTQQITVTGGGGRGSIANSGNKRSHGGRLLCTRESPCEFLS